MANRFTALFAEAKRRRVFRTAGVYLVAVWGVSQGAAELGPLFGAPDWFLRYGVLAAVAFLPVVVVLAWMFDIDRSGIVRDPQDVESLAQAEDDLARMPTMLGGENGSGVGAVVVHWRDGAGEHGVLYWDEFFVGRGVDCLVRFYDPLVSRKHARVYPEDGTWYIEDLGSRNGTLVSEKKILRQALSGVHDVRVNDAGPVLRLETVEAGPPTQAALATYSAHSSTAHIRPITGDTTAASRAVTRN